jgi:2-polyprenyl-6-methoxyphenol hydroxylase-like FAD-dependent oxidoreductase
MKGLIVSRDPSNADTPRAHITNMATLDCLRDFGLDTQCYKLGTGNDSIMHTRWSNTMAGEEYGRIYSWGNDPRRKVSGYELDRGQRGTDLSPQGDYELASPSHMLDLPQTLLEPVLIRHATLNGFKCRWDTEFVSFEQDADGVTTMLLDKLSGATFEVRSRYLFGADGARSNIVRQAEIPMIRRPGQGWAVNVRIKADLKHLIDHRMGNLHWIIQPNLETPEWAWLGCFRMVKPWYEWMCIIFTAPAAERKIQSNEAYLSRVKEMLGDDDIDVEILDVSTWPVNSVLSVKASVVNCTKSGSFRVLGAR